MEEKSVSIQSDEVTKNMMSELQYEMADSLSKVSKNMTADLMDKLKPLEKKIADLKVGFEEFQEEDFEQKIDELNSNMLKVTKSIKNTIEESFNKIISEQNEILDDRLKKLLENSKEIKDLIDTRSNFILNKSSSNKNEIMNKIENINFTSVEDKIRILGKYLENEGSTNKVEIINKINEINTEKIEKNLEEIDKSMERNFFDNKKIISENIKKIGEKVDQKEILIQVINRLEGELTQKIDNIQEEVEWGNRSFFSRFFGKRRK